MTGADVGVYLRKWVRRVISEPIEYLREHSVAFKFWGGPWNKRNCLGPRLGGRYLPGPEAWPAPGGSGDRWHCVFQMGRCLTGVGQLFAETGTTGGGCWEEVGLASRAPGKWAGLEGAMPQSRLSCGVS